MIKYFKVYDCAMSINKIENDDKIHPINFTAAVIFTDGSIEVAKQLKVFSIY